MALPKLNSPTYELEQPSTGEMIKYRPFLVREQKQLMMAQESEDETSIKNAMADVITQCTFEKINPLDIPLFDVELLFLRIRSKSVGENVDLNLLCPDDEKTKVTKTIKLEDVDVIMKEGHTNEIAITDKIKIVMRYPRLDDMLGADEIEDIFKMVYRCVHEIHDGEKVYHKIDMSEKELVDFVDSLTSEQFEKVTDFFDSKPKVPHVVEETNPKTKKKGEVVIDGVASFF